MVRTEWQGVFRVEELTDSSKPISQKGGERMLFVSMKVP